MSPVRDTGWYYTYVLRNTQTGQLYTGLKRYLRPVRDSCIINLHTKSKRGFIGNFCDRLKGQSLTGLSLTG